MDEKCWYILRQQIYSPPTPPPSGSVGVPWKGSICLGHIISGPKGLDHVENGQDLIPFGADMPVYRSQELIVDVESKEQVSFYTSVGAAGPTGAFPVDLSVDSAAVFKKTVENHSHFESLDTYFVQPTNKYVREMLETSSIKAYVEKLRKKHLGFDSWKFYMISGMKIARGASQTSKETEEKGANSGISVEVPDIVGGHLKIGGGKTTELGITYGKSTDFIWSLRLTKIDKGFWSSEFELKTEMLDGVVAACSLEPKMEVDQPELRDVLKSKGLSPDAVHVYSAARDDLFFVVQPESGEGKASSDELKANDEER